MNYNNSILQQAIQEQFRNFLANSLTSRKTVFPQPFRVFSVAVLLSNCFLGMNVIYIYTVYNVVPGSDLFVSVYINE